MTALALDSAMTDPAARLFEPANALEELLVAASRGDPAQQAAFARALPTETLYVGTPDAMPEGRRTLTDPTAVRLMSLPMKDGRRATAVFTSPQRLMTAFGEGAGCLGLPGRTLFQMIRATPAVLNPGSPYGVVWEPDALATLAAMPGERVVEKETEVLLGAPTEVPTELMAMLKAVLEPMPAVRAAWLALSYWPGSMDTVWHLDVRSDGDREALRAAIGAALAGGIPGERKLDLVINAPGGEDGLGLPLVEPREAGAAPAGKANGQGGGKGLIGRLFGD